MTEFEVIPKAEAQDLIAAVLPLGSNPRISPITAAIRAGEVVFIPGETEGASRTRYYHSSRSAATPGMRVRTRRIERNGVSGLLVWMEPKGE